MEVVWISWFWISFVCTVSKCERISVGFLTFWRWCKMADRRQASVPSPWGIGPSETNGPNHASRPWPKRPSLEARISPLTPAVCSVIARHHRRRRHREDGCFRRWGCRRNDSGGTLAFLRGLEGADHHPGRRRRWAGPRPNPLLRFLELAGRSLRRRSWSVGSCGFGWLCRGGRSRVRAAVAAPGAPWSRPRRCHLRR